MPLVMLMIMADMISVRRRFVHGWEDHFELFRAYLESLGRSPLTVEGYLRDLRDFACWFLGKTGRELWPELLTPYDVRDYREHLLAVRRARPAHVNRRFAAIRAYVRWARHEGLIRHDPAQVLALAASSVCPA